MIAGKVSSLATKHFLIKFDATGINSQQVTKTKLCIYKKMLPAQVEISTMSMMTLGRKTCPELVEGNRDMEQRASSRHTSIGFTRCGEREHLV